MIIFGTIMLFVGVLISIVIIGLLSGAKTNDLLDEIVRLRNMLRDKEQEYCKLICDYNQLKKYNDNTDKMLTKLVRETKVGGSE